MSFTLPPLPRWVTIRGITVDRHSVQTIERVDLADGGADVQYLHEVARLHLAFGCDQDILCSPTFDEYNAMPIAGRRELLRRFVEDRYDEVVREITGVPKPAHNRLPRIEL